MPPNIPEFIQRVSSFRPRPISGQPVEVQKIQGALQRMGNIPRDSRLLSDQIAQKAQIKQAAARFLMPDLQTPKIITPKEAKIVVPKRYLQKGSAMMDFDDGETWNEMLFDAAESDNIVRARIADATADLFKDHIDEAGVDSVPHELMQTYENYLRDPQKWGDQLREDLEDWGFDNTSVIEDIALNSVDHLIARGLLLPQTEFQGKSWDPFGDFQRLPELPGDQYFTSVLRGSPVPKGHDLSGASGHFVNPSQYGHVRGTYNPKAHLVKVDELQSDPLEVDPTDPRLKNIYGQLGKAMIQGAVDTGEAGVLFPTGEAITSVRSPRHRKFYEDVYDRNLSENLFDPLSDLGIPIGKTNAYRGVDLSGHSREKLMDNPDFFNYAEGGLVDFPPELTSEINDYLKGTTRSTFRPTKYGSDPIREGQHLTSFDSQAADREKHQALANLRHAASNWLTDVPASIGDLADMGYHGIRKVLNGQSEKSFAPLGWGPAIRKKLRGIPDSTTTSMSDGDVPLSTTIGELANPLLFMNPKHLANPKVLGALAALHGVPDAMGALGVIKPRGGTWVSPANHNTMLDMLTKTGPHDTYRNLPPEILNALDQDSLSLLKNYKKVQGENPQEWLKAMSKHAPVDAWVNRQLKNYMLKDMGSPKDPIRELADQGIRHHKLDTLMTEDLHQSPGRIIMSTTPEGRRWEDIVDSKIGVRPAYEQMRANSDQTPQEVIDQYNKAQSQLPSRKVNDQGMLLPAYLSKVPAEENIYSLRHQDPHTYGFDHLVDELTNALRGEASGLPRNLQLTPEAVNNMSVEKAVRRVSDINDFREKQLVETNKALANNPAVHSLREYPDTPELPNPRGLRWVELKMADDPPMPEGGYDVSGVDARGAARQTRMDELQKQLQYEGDTMKHCVGGYCDDVAAGRSRIFSLRDAAGEPHTTIEVNRTEPWMSWKASEDPEADFLTYMNKKHGTSFEDLGDLDKWDKLTPDQQRDLYRESDDAWDSSNWFARMAKHLVEPQWYGYEKWPDSGKLQIAQIKGKANGAPKAEYQPFVQDFVKNNPLGGEWGDDIGDFKNTGLINMGEFTGNHITGYHTPDEAIKAVQAYQEQNPGSTFGAWITELEKMKANNGN